MTAERAGRMLPRITRFVTKVLGDALVCYDHVNSSVDHISAAASHP
jgi:hypothetical protein